MTQDTITAILRQTAGMVAGELGEGWAVDVEATEEHGHAAIVTGPDGERLYIRNPDGPYSDLDRVEVSGTFWHLATNDQIPYGLERPRPITVKRDRGPAVIAREIGRRLLPAYREAIATVRAHVDRDEQAKAARAALAERFPNVARSSDDGRSLTLHFAKKYGRSATISFDASQVSMELRWLDADLAVKVAELVAEYREVTS